MLNNRVFYSIARQRPINNVPHRSDYDTLLRVQYVTIFLHSF